MNLLRILQAGPLCTLQDAGRTGYLRFGVTPAGPMDWIQHRTANLLAGNAPAAGAVEIGPGGLTLTAEGGPVRIGLAARGFRVRRDGSALPTRIALTVERGARLEVAPGPFNLWAYMAVQGGFVEPPVMGSQSTHLRSGLGPFGGQAFRAGQGLEVAKGTPGKEWAVIEPYVPDETPIRFVPGPQDDFFSPVEQSRFSAATWRVARRSDRMAYRLDGPALTHAKGHDIVSDGIALGAIQVPGDGLPLVLMADRQPTGGYPKIGTVIRADLPRLAQTRPGQAVRFAPVTVAEAVAALRGAVPDAEALRSRAMTLRRVQAAGPAGKKP